MSRARAALRGIRDGFVASDPGLVRLRMAVTTIATLVVSLGLLYVITLLAGQPLTVALLGVVISMISSMAFAGPDVRERAVTAVTMMGAAAVAVTLGVLLASHTVISDIVFVAIMVGATEARRFGTRGTMLGMVGFMTYFFALFLGARLSMVGWLIFALAIGTATSSRCARSCSGTARSASWRRTLNALRVRVVGVVDALADELEDGTRGSAGAGGCGAG